MWFTSLLLLPCKWSFIKLCSTLSDRNYTLPTFTGKFRYTTLCSFLMEQNLSRLLLSLISFNYYHFKETLIFSWKRREDFYFLWFWLSSFMCLNSSIWNTHSAVRNKNMTGWGILKAPSTLFPLKSLLVYSTLLWDESLGSTGAWFHAVMFP